MGYVRLMLAMIVAIGHSQSDIVDLPFDYFIYMCGPILAVKIFFLISGYYMAMIYGNYKSGPLFLASRAARLWPAYWLTLTIGLVAAFALDMPRVGPYLSFTGWQHLPWWAVPLFAVSEFSFLGIDLSLFTCTTLDEHGHFLYSLLPSTECNPGAEYGILHYAIPPAWTLALEFYFYMMVPWFHRLKSRSLVILLLASAGVNVAFIQAGLYYIPWNRSSFPGELWLFLIGFLAFRHRDMLEGRVGKVCAVVALMMFGGYQMIGLDWYKPGLAQIPQIMIFGLAMPVLFEYGNRLPGEALAGDLSYPIYISHTTVLSITLARHTFFGFTAWGWVLGNTLSILLAALALYYVIKPVELWRTHWKTRLLYQKGNPPWK